MLQWSISRFQHHSCCLLCYLGGKLCMFRLLLILNNVWFYAYVQCKCDEVTHVFHLDNAGATANLLASNCKPGFQNKRRHACVVHRNYNWHALYLSLMCFLCDRLLVHGHPKCVKHTYITSNICHKHHFPKEILVILRFIHIDSSVQ